MLAELQQLLVAALAEPDPLEFLRQHVARTPGLTPAERQWLSAIDGDGLRLTRMLVRKLRMQRIVRGDPAAARLMTEDPERFAECFARYDREVPLRHVFPRDEADEFRRYW